jgi:hypothetical protein
VGELQRAPERGRYAVALARRYEEHMEAAAEHERERKQEPEGSRGHEHAAAATEDAVEDELRRFEVEEYDEPPAGQSTGEAPNAAWESAPQQQQQKHGGGKEERGGARSGEYLEPTLQTKAHGQRNAPRLRSQATECLVAHLADALRGNDRRAPLARHPLVQRHGVPARDVRGLCGAFVRVCTPLVPIQTLRRAGMAHVLPDASRGNSSNDSSSSRGASLADIVDGEKYRAEQQQLGAARIDAIDMFTLYIV